MIPVYKTSEPAELASERTRRLAALRTSPLPTGSASDNQAFYKAHSKVLEGGYGVCRAALLREQHRKCAYCERKVSPSAHIDHHRPRRGEHGGYFWLAWSYENLLVTCNACNGKKGDRFPVDGPRLQAWSAKRLEEKPIFIDPASEDPTLHVFFVLDENLGKWVATGRTQRGRKTLRQLALVQHDEDWQDRIKCLERQAKRVLRAMDVGPAWDELLDCVLDPTEAFVALTRAWLAWRFEQSWRDAHGVELRPPPDAPTPFTADHELPTLPDATSSLPQVLRMHLAALGNHPTVAQTRDALVAFSQHGSWSTHTLESWFPQQVSTLKNHLRTLCQLGRVRFDQDVLSGLE